LSCTLTAKFDPHFLIFLHNDPSTAVIHTLSLHDALPISNGRIAGRATGAADPMSEKSALPMSAPIAVPRTRPMRMDRREIVADPTLLSRRMMPKVMKAKRMLLIEP